MKQYKDFQGVTHLIGNDTQFVEVLKAELLELRMQLLEKDKELKTVKHEKSMLESFLSEAKTDKNK